MESHVTTNSQDIAASALRGWSSLIQGPRNTLFAAACAALLFACGGGADGSAGNSGAMGSCGTDCGAALITLQDAAGDFQSYTVDVVSLKLRKASGALVETVPATTRVDFAQLVSLSELISAGQIPSGDYVAATITLDYANASISADDGTGGSVALTPVDSQGNALSGQLELGVQLDNRHHLVITRARTARLAFDFNLAASNVVDLTSATVQVAPLIQASVVPPADLNIRVRGALVSTDTAASSYTLNLRPFHLPQADVGQLVVHTGSATSYEIDGVSYSGDAGLAQLASMPAGTLTAAFGTLQTGDYTFTAERVLAGTSVGGNQSDLVQGVVAARSGNTLTVRGATLDRRDGGFEYLRGLVTVTIADSTHVTEAGQVGSFGIGAVSVGQRIAAAGTVTIDSATGAATLDASTGRVRLEITPMWGLVTGALVNPLVLDLQAIDGRNPGTFDFTGTGASPASDANPAAYVVDTGTLPLGGLAIGAPARVFGFVVPFASATASDFRALSVVSYADVGNELVANWSQGGSSGAFPGLGMAASALELDLGGVGTLHFLQVGPGRINLLSLDATPRIVAPLAATGSWYAIGHVHSRAIDNYSSFGDFIAALAAAMQGSTTALGLTAEGKYDATGNSFSARHLAVLLSD
jgi:hypothetical protein